MDVYLCYHFTTFAWPNLSKQLKDQVLCYISWKIPHVAENADKTHIKKTYSNSRLPT